jgi:hypothetical protein
MYFNPVGFVYVYADEDAAYAVSEELPIVSDIKPVSIFPSIPVITTTCPLAGAVDVEREVLKERRAPVLPREVELAASCAVASSVNPAVVSFAAATAPKESEFA